MRRVYVAASLALLVAALGGCSMFGKKQDVTRNWSAERLYVEAHKAMNDYDFSKAIGYYEKLETRFPFGVLATQAQLEQAYAYYKSDQPASALATLDRFIRLNPESPEVAYALYLKGLVDFNQGRSFLDRFLPVDDAERDPAGLRQAFQVFGELLRRFPHSKYAADARQRMVYLRNVLARHELDIARFYYRRKAYVAAANRARYLVRFYSGTPSVPDALVLMVESYRALGLPGPANDALAVLKANFPKLPALARLETVAER